MGDEPLKSIHPAFKMKSVVTRLASREVAERKDTVTVTRPATREMADRRDTVTETPASTGDDFWRLMQHLGEVDGRTRSSLFLRKQFFDLLTGTDRHEYPSVDQKGSAETLWG